MASRSIRRTRSAPRDVAHYLRKQARAHLPDRIRKPLGFVIFSIVHALTPRRWLEKLALTLARFLPYPPMYAVSAPQLPGHNAPLGSEPEEEQPFPLLPDANAPVELAACGDPLVTILIPAHNHWAHTCQCLRAIGAHTADVEYEVILADDASDDETVHAEELVKNLAVVRDDRQRGFLETVNNAATHARGEFLLLLNNDTVVQPGWLEWLIDTVRRDRAIGVVGAKLVFPNGKVQEAGSVIWRTGQAANYGRDSEPDAPEVNYLKEVDYVSGACMLVRRSLWEKVGGFDEQFAPGYYEDVDFVFEARKRGYRVVYQPKAAVVHFEGVSHGTDTSAGVKRYQVLHRDTFVAKWRDVLEREQEEEGEIYHARDRSAGKRRILVIDHEVPQHDRDAGSRFVRDYLELLVELGFHVVFLPGDFNPVQPYTTELQQLGIEVLCGHWYGRNFDRWLARHANHIDAAYVHRIFVADRYVDLLRREGIQRIVYSPVDLEYLRERRRLALTGTDSDRGLVARRKRTELEVLRAADVVHVVSGHEEEILRRAIPTLAVRTVPVYLLEEKEAGPCPPFEERRNLMFVGGFMHQPNTDAVLWFAHEVYPLVRERIPDALFFVVGSNPPEGVRMLAGDGIVVTGRVSDRMLAELYRQVRVVVCPLRYGAGVKGKVVESLFHGVPTVATPAAAEGFVGLSGELLLARDAKSFADQIVRAHTDRDLWQTLSTRGRAYALTRFSREGVAAMLEEDFGSPRVERVLAGR